MKYTLAAALVLCMALPAMAILGLPIADDGQSETGMMRVSGGITLESDIKMYGARFTYGINDDISLFGGLGLFDFHRASIEPYFQLGGTYALSMLDLPFELAIRSAFGLVSYEYSGSSHDYHHWYHGRSRWKTEITAWTLNLAALGSKQFQQLDMFTFYGLAGFSIVNQSIKTSFSHRYAGIEWSDRASDSDTDFHPAIAAGALYTLNDQFSFYGELAFIDDLFFNAGARYRF